MKIAMLFMQCVLFCLLVGCGITRDEMCDAGRGSIYNPLAAPCLIHGIGRDIASIGSKKTMDTPGDNVWRISKEVNEDMDKDPEFRAFVEESQKKFKTGDYGVASKKQMEDSTAKYVSKTCKKPLLIINDGNWRIEYE